MSKPLAFGLFQLVCHFFTSGLAFFVHLDLAILILSPENCRQSLQVKSSKAEVKAEKKPNSRLQSKSYNTSSEIITN